MLGKFVEILCYYPLTKSAFSRTKLKLISVERLIFWSVKLYWQFYLHLDQISKSKLIFSTCIACFPICIFHRMLKQQGNISPNRVNISGKSIDKFNKDLYNRARNIKKRSKRLQKKTL